MNDVISFRTFKLNFTPNLDVEDDFFLNSKQYGCNESRFEQWLRKQRLFIKRYTNNLECSLLDMKLTCNKWHFFSETFQS